MKQRLDELMAELNSDYRTGRLNGVVVVKAVLDGSVKYRYSSYAASHPAHFIGYLTAMCSELAAVLTGKHN